MHYEVHKKDFVSGIRLFINLNFCSLLNDRYITTLVHVTKLSKFKEITSY